jgi:hypothetical protein
VRAMFAALMLALMSKLPLHNTHNSRFRLPMRANQGLVLEEILPRMLTGASCRPGEVLKGGRLHLPLPESI